MVVKLWYKNAFLLKKVKPFTKLNLINEYVLLVMVIKNSQSFSKITTFPANRQSDFFKLI